MNKRTSVVTVAGITALAMIMATIATSDVWGDSKKNRAKKVLDKHIFAGGKHGDKACEKKNKLNGHNPDH